MEEGESATEVRNVDELGIAEDFAFPHFFLLWLHKSLISEACVIRRSGITESTDF